MPMTPPPLPLVSSVENIRDRDEGTAFTFNVIFATVAVLALFFVSWLLIPIALLTWLLGFFLAAHLKGSGIKVTAGQFPELHAALERVRARLTHPEVDVYVVQDSAFNAFATRMASRNFVVLNTGAVDAILRKGDAEQLEFLIGHECGHVVFGHVSLVRGAIPRVTELLCPPLYAWYRRCQERSADRAGLWACGSRLKAVRGLCTLAGGAELGPVIKLQEVRNQWDGIKHEFFVKYYTFWSHYPHLTNRIVLVDNAANEFGMP